MIFNISSSSNSKVKVFYEKSMKELCAFYDINWNKNTPRVYLIKNRKEFDLLQGRKTQDWVVGCTMGSTHEIFVLDPESYETESHHKYSDDEYSKLIKHELSHLFSRIWYTGYIPIWLCEGIAILSSDQLEEKERPEELKLFLDFFNKGGSGVYDESGFAVEVLVKEGGIKKFLEFYSNLKTVREKDDLEKLFKKYYGFELNYEFFNNRL